MASPSPKGELKEAPLVEHLEELRARIIKALLFWAIGAGIAYAYRVQLLAWLKAPLDRAAAQNQVEVNLIVLDITEPFVTALKVAVFGGFVIALPFIVYQAWAFVAPGLYPHERRLAGPFILIAGFSFAVGVAFAYYVLLPFAVPFLLGFLGDVVTPQISIGRYIGQILTYMTVMGLLFEMPVLAYFLARLGLLSASFLARNWRVAVVGVITLAAIITPTVDVVNLALVSVPLLVLYWISVVVARIDGASYLVMLFKIALPLAVPGLITYGIFSFLGAYNALLWPLIVTQSPEMRTVQVGLQAFIGEAGSDYGQLMAASTMAILPIIVGYFFAQRQFIEGIARSGIK